MAEIMEPITAITIGISQQSGDPMVVLMHLDGAQTEVKRDADGKWQMQRMIRDDPDNPGHGFVFEVEGELMEDPIEIARGFLEGTPEHGEAEVIDMKDRSPHNGFDHSA